MHLLSFQYVRPRIDFLRTQPAEVSQPDAERLIWWETMIGMAGFELQAPRGSGLCSIAVLTSVAGVGRSEPKSQLP